MSPTPRLVDLHLPALPGAACRGWPEPLWDLDLPDERQPARNRRHADARLWCDPCPARSACLAYGLANDLHGIYGGQLLEPVDVGTSRAETAAAELTAQDMTAALIAWRLGISTRSVQRARARTRQEVA